MVKRKSLRVIGLILVGAAAFAGLRRWLHRSDQEDADPSVQPPALTTVPDLEPDHEADVRPGPDLQSVDAETSAAPPAHLASVPPPVDTASSDAASSDTGPSDDDTGQSWRPPVDEECPDGYPVKVNERSGIYHVPGGLSYERTRPTRCYPDEAAAEADGFRRAKR